MTTATLAPTPGSQTNEFDFAGQQTDPTTDLQYLRARYYDPAAGIFLSRDPLSNAAGWRGSPYGYAAARPINLTDSRGLNPIPGYDKMNSMERDWCTSFSGNLFSVFGRARACWKVNLLREKAWAKTDQLYGVNADDGPSYAFRHCYWIGMCALQFGGDDARDFGIRHEDGKTDIKARVDLYNNDFGIVIAEFLRDEYRWKTVLDKRWARQTLADICQSSIKRGWLVTADNDPRVNQ